LGACTHLGGGHKAVGAAALFGAVDAAVLALVVWCGVRGRRAAPECALDGPGVSASATSPWSPSLRAASPTA
jgi:hypothetical protein